MTLFEYRTIRIKRASWPRVTDEIFGHVADASQAAGGSVFALCAGLIGLASDEGILMRAWDEDALAHHADGTLAGTPTIKASAWEMLSPVLGAGGVDRPHAPGVYAHRWFWVQEENWKEFERLFAEGIWPYLQSDGCETVGQWRATGPGRQAKVLLITRYPDLAHWDRTRLRGKTPAGADEALYRRARDAGRRRAELTERSIVHITRLLLPRD